MTQTVVITGANRGLGLELARVFAGRGDTVIAGCRNPAAATELRSITENVLAVDMGDPASIEAFVATVGEHVGDGAVDVLINNAGIDARTLGAADGERDVLVQPMEHVTGQIEVNSYGPLRLARGLLPQLRRSRRGRIINVSSQVGSMEISQQLGRDLGYAVSKAALNMITVKLASRLRDEGIVAIMLHPGHLKTDMGGSAASMDTDDAARQIADLIDGLTIDDTGTFRRWDGSVHPW